jgi:hypothetical protein
VIQTREAHTATVLDDGDVLIAGGGASEGYLASAEIFDPVTNLWRAAASMNSPRSEHRAVRLASGKVLVVGGASTGGLVDSAEIYDPVLDRWGAAASSGQIVSQFSLTALSNSRVLLAGGLTGNRGSAVALLYDPTTNTWSPAANMGQARWGHAAVVLPSGKVLVIGGDKGLGAPLASAELYDPVTNTWAPAGTMAAARNYTAAVLLQTGKVLVAGGSSLYGVGGPMASAEIYDPATNQWTTVGNLATARTVAAAALLGDGQVLVSGGQNVLLTTFALASAEIFDPVTGLWSDAFPMHAARSRPTATTLGDGSVLVVGCHSSQIACAGADRSEPLEQVFLPMLQRS